MSSKNAFAIPFVLLILLAAWEYRNRPRFEFVPNDVKVTIPEGTNIADVDRILAKAEIIRQGTLLKPEYLKLEGALFPDTYRFDRGSTAEDVILRMKKAYDQRDVLVIASILEKEVRTETDMKLVAGIIQKRIDAGMPLQIDAAVAYGACLPKFNLGQYCDVSQINLVDNIKRDSPYNTYTRVGLPAGPISNPGLQAFQAALNSTDNPYWYYLSAHDGTTIFSKTLEEHNRAKARYLR